MRCRKRVAFIFKMVATPTLFRVAMCLVPCEQYRAADRLSPGSLGAGRYALRHRDRPVGLCNLTNRGSRRGAHVLRVGLGHKNSGNSGGLHDR